MSKLWMTSLAPFLLYSLSFFIGGLEHTQNRVKVVKEQGITQFQDIQASLAHLAEQLSPPPSFFLCCSQLVELDSNRLRHDKEQGLEPVLERVEGIKASLGGLNQKFRFPPFFPFFLSSLIPPSKNNKKSGRVNPK